MEATIVADSITVAIMAMRKVDPCLRRRRNMYRGNNIILSFYGFWKLNCPSTSALPMVALRVTQHVQGHVISVVFFFGQR